METFENLHHYVQSGTSDNLKEFEAAVQALAKTENPKILEQLFDLFDDKCPDYGILSKVLHAVESYPRDVYVKTLLKKLKDGMDKYPFWLDCLCNRVFNTADYFETFKKNIHIPGKDYALGFIELMEKESPSHRKHLSELRLELATPTSKNNP